MKRKFDGGALLAPVPAVLVSCGDMENSNMLTVAWTGIVSTKPAMLYISVRKERYSYNIIKNSKQFVINLTTENLVFATDYAGVRSGRDIDKFEKLGLTKVKATNINCPMIAESPVNIECKVEKIIELGSHDMFLSRIVAVNIDEKYIDKNDSFDISKCKLITYAHGHYYKLGSELGKFGFSVQKKKSKNKKIDALEKNNISKKHNKNKTNKRIKKDGKK